MLGNRLSTPPQIQVGMIDRSFSSITKAYLIPFFLKEYVALAREIILLLLRLGIPTEYFCSSK
ncbi:MAG: hypothetical protein JETT_1211 [Candidatus Jettenia ecosi]|uniref:Uncharacterized protein n=1 Tax=Candidatus Jettenia ecosi TaxID=2494326 RepID=A0A533QCN2_9BACT|nr:MAG: hypothetical protein JETT_1211 [Candidatus Jettenia ecosi]